MTAQSYIVKKFSAFGFEVDTGEVDVLLGAQGLSLGAELTPENLTKVKHVIHSLIPEMLLLPEISQGRYSVKHNIEGIKSYYALLSSELGIENKLEPQPEIRDRSNLW